MNVVRKFEVRTVEPATLATIETRLQTASQQLGAGLVVTEIEAIEHPPLLKVRLTGDPSAVSTVEGIAEAFPGATIRYDVLGLIDSEDAPSYPDRKQLLRMDAHLLDPSMSSGSLQGLAGPPEMADVTVAIVDTGMMISHPDLATNVWTSDMGGKHVYGFRSMNGTEDNDVGDDDGHGTQLAGTVLAGANQALTVKLMPLKFFDGSTRPAAANAARCIDLAVEHGADILLLSFDVGIPDEALRTAIANASAAGLLVVIAAGNDGGDNSRFPSVPSCYAAENPDNAIVVMATDRFDERPYFSNYGAEVVDIAAPGVRIMTTCPFLTDSSKGYRLYSGTSVAAAHVAGAAALLKSYEPKLTAREIKDRLLIAVKPIGGRLGCARGRLNLGELFSETPANP
jgi:subtilisin family serine protease